MKDIFKQISVDGEALWLADVQAAKSTSGRLRWLGTAQKKPQETCSCISIAGR